MNDLNNLREEVINSLEYHRDKVKFAKGEELEDLIEIYAEDFINNYDCKKLILELLKKEGKTYAKEHITDNYEAHITILVHMSPQDIKAESEEKAYKIAEGYAEQKMIALGLDGDPQTAYDIVIKQV